jgi:hypothetical protein
VASGICLSVASGLPLGKEGPLIRASSSISAAVSQVRVWVQQVSTDCSAGFSFGGYSR